jgi:hypothetical protein
MMVNGTSAKLRSILTQAYSSLFTVYEQQVIYRIFAVKQQSNVSSSVVISELNEAILTLTNFPPNIADILQNNDSQAVKLLTLGN